MKWYPRNFCQSRKKIMNFEKILICTRVVEERVTVLIQGYNDRVLERGQIRKSPGVD